MIGKVYLKSFEIEKFQALNTGGDTFILKCQKIILWGLLKRDKEIIYTIPFHESFDKYFNHWNKLIKEGRPLDSKKTF